jgi:hypothetical protein
MIGLIISPSWLDFCSLMGMNRAIWLLVLCFALLSFQPKKKTYPAKSMKMGVATLTKPTPSNPEAYKNDARMIYYGKERKNETPIHMANRNDMPEMIEKVTALLYDEKNEHLLYSVEDNISEFGDYTLQYKHYFDNEGNTIAFERYCGFFHSRCLHNDALHETTIFYYGKNLQLKNKLHTFTTPEGKPIDSARCDFPYDYPFTVSPNVSSYLASRHISSK